MRRRGGMGLGRTLPAGPRRDRDQRSGRGHGDTLRNRCDGAPTARRPRRRSGARPGHRGTGPGRCTAGCASRRVGPAGVGRLLDGLEQGAPDIEAPGGGVHEQVLQVALGLPGPGRGMDDAVGHPDAFPEIVEGQEAEQAVFTGAEAVERGSGGLLRQLLPVEGEVPAPQGPPVVPVVVAQRPDRATPSALHRAAARRRDRFGTRPGLDSRWRAPLRGLGARARRTSRGPGPAGPGSRGG